MTKVAFFNTKPYDEKAFAPHLQANTEKLEAVFYEYPLNSDTVSLTKGFDAICIFVNDAIDEALFSTLAEFNVKHIALRCAGFNNVHLPSASKYGIEVSRVPAYSPEAVAEHSVGLMLTLGRKLHKAYNRVRDGNFELDGLQGLTLNGKTVGVVGTGHIGIATAKILLGFGCNVLCFDVTQNEKIKALGANYVTIEELYKQCDVISLHCPLLEQTHHMVNSDSIDMMKEGVMIINTSRGGLIHTADVIAGLKSGKIGFLGLDVYEMESDLFFKNLSETIILDDQFERLSSFHNVLITGHQGFFTHEALDEIAHVTVGNILSQSIGELASPYLVTSDE